MQPSTILNTSLLLTIFASSAFALPHPHPYFSDTLHEILNRDTPASPPPKDRLIKKLTIGGEEISIRTTPSPSPEVNIRGDIALGSRNSKIVPPK